MYEPGKTAMHDQRYYLYAFAAADCTLQEAVPGIDPRFNAELLRHGSLAGVTSRVRSKQFDAARFQGKTLRDAKWLHRVAIRHNRVICEAAKSSPVLPLRLGTLFRSRCDLLAKMAQCEATVVDFLSGLGDRQEWAVKIYSSTCWAAATPGHSAPSSPHYAMEKRSVGQRAADKPARQPSEPAPNCPFREEIVAVETALEHHAARWSRVDVPTAGATGTRSRTAWNKAFLLSRSEQQSWLKAMERVRQDVADRGLFLVVTGPWPPYHFCPTLDK